MDLTNLLIHSCFNAVFLSAYSFLLLGFVALTLLLNFKKIGYEIKIDSMFIRAIPLIEGKCWFLFK